MIIAWNDEETGSCLQATTFHIRRFCYLRYNGTIASIYNSSPISNFNAIKISIILSPFSKASINRVTSINNISQSLIHKLNTIKIIILSKSLGDALINRVDHLKLIFPSHTEGLFI